MLKEEIYEISKEIVNYKNLDVDAEELSAFAAYKISRMPYLKKNFSYFSLYKDNADRFIFGHHECNDFNNVTNNNLRKTKINFNELNNDCMDEGTRILLTEDERAFLKDFKNKLNKSNNIMDIVNYVNENKKIYDLISYFYNNHLTKDLTNTLRENCFAIKEKGKEKKIKIYNEDSDRFKMDSMEIRDNFFYKLNDLLKMNKKQIKDEILGEDFRDFKKLFSNKEFLSFCKLDNLAEKDYKKKLFDKFVKNKDLYENSILKVLLENTPEDRRLSLYNKFLFQERKVDLLRKIDKVLKEDSIENCFKKYGNEINEVCGKIISKYPFFELEETDLNDMYIVQKGKVADEHLSYDFLDDFIKEDDEYKFYENEDQEMGAMGIKYFGSDLIKYSKNFAFEVFCLRDSYEVKGMAKVNINNISKNSDLKMATFSIITMNQKCYDEKYKVKLIDAIFNYANENNMVLRLDFVRDEVDFYYNAMRKVAEKYPDLIVNYDFEFFNWVNREKMKNHNKNNARKSLLETYFDNFRDKELQKNYKEIKVDIEKIDCFLNEKIVEDNNEDKFSFYDFLRNNDNEINEMFNSFWKEKKIHKQVNNVKKRNL